MTRDRSRPAGGLPFQDPAGRAALRHLLALLASRLVPAVLVVLLLIGLLLALAPTAGAALALAMLALFALLGVTTMLLDRNRALVGQWPGLAFAAAAVQALFYTACIATTLFAFVLRAPVLLSGVVTANLFGLLLWRFRRRYLDAADDLAAPRFAGAKPGDAVT